MAEPRCEKCDLLLDQCEHGRFLTEPRWKARATLLESDGPTITANTVSPCVGCGENIEPGESITHTEDGWAHAQEVRSRKAPPTPPSEFEGII